MEKLNIEAVKSGTSEECSSVLKDFILKVRNYITVFIESNYLNAMLSLFFSMRKINSFLKSLLLKRKNCGKSYFCEFNVRQLLQSSSAFF